MTIKVTARMQGTTEEEVHPVMKRTRDGIKIANWTDMRDQMKTDMKEATGMKDGETVMMAVMTKDNVIDTMRAGTSIEKGTDKIETDMTRTDIETVVKVVIEKEMIEKDKETEILIPEEIEPKKKLKDDTKMKGTEDTDHPIDLTRQKVQRMRM